MASNNHKGTELNNIKETWDQNEKNLRNGDSASPEGNAGNGAAPANELEKLVKQEAAEYDNTNKEERVLGGDRATVKDEETDNG